MLMFVPQEHLRAGVVAFMLKIAPSLHEEHLNWDRQHHNFVEHHSQVFSSVRVLPYHSSTLTHYLHVLDRVPLSECQRYKSRS